MQSDIQSHERPHTTIFLPRLLLRVQVSPRGVRMQAFEIAALRSTGQYFDTARRPVSFLAKKARFVTTSNVTTSNVTTSNVRSCH